MTSQPALAACTGNKHAESIPQHASLLSSPGGAPQQPCLVLRRAAGVKRNMRGDEARKLCPELQLVQASALLLRYKSLCCGGWSAAG